MGNRVEISSDYSAAQLSEIMLALMDRQATLSELAKELTPTSAERRKVEASMRTIQGLFEHFADMLADSLGVRD
jgi:hypothetical protein